jgi:hypothetical protein
MKKAEKKAVEKQMPGRVLGRVLAEELGEVRGGVGLVLAVATGSSTVTEIGHLDFTGGRQGQTDGD